MAVYDAAWPGWRDLNRLHRRALVAEWLRL
jgi:hypothetical protein